MWRERQAVRVRRHRMPGAAGDAGGIRGDRVPPMMWATWERKQWASLVAVLLVVIVVLLSLWPRNTVPDHIEIRVVDSSLGKVYSTQVVPLR